MMEPPVPRHSGVINGSTTLRLAYALRRLARPMTGVPRCVGTAGLLITALLAGCQDNTVPQLRQEVADLRSSIKEKDNQLVAQKAALDKLNDEVTRISGITPEDLKKVFYPAQLVIDKLSGGYDIDSKPGDDGVTVYLKPIDNDGDVIKVAGEIDIQLYDLAAPPQQNFIGEYKIPLAKVRELWHGKLWTNHYAIKCPWPGAPPQHPEITIRAVFTDFLTKRVVAAQSTCLVKLPP